MKTFAEFQADKEPLDERTRTSSRVKAQEYSYQEFGKPIKTSKGLSVGMTYTGPMKDKRETAIIQTDDGMFFAAKDKTQKKFKTARKAADAYFA